MAKLNYRINQNIAAKEVRVVDRDGKQLGVMPTVKALGLAREKRLDLVEVAPNADPPVARLIDFGKLVHERREQKKAERRERGQIKLKEIRIRPNIGDADLAVRVRRAEKFLKAGNWVKLSVAFRGREFAHPEIGLEKIDRLMKELSEIATREKEPMRKGRQIEALLVPKALHKEKKEDAESKD